MTTVILGPADSLHNGIHGALEASPPPGVRYVRMGGLHRFVFASEHGGPLDSFALCQGVDFGPGTDIVQSAYWPVLGRGAWLVETGDLLFSLFCGHFGYSSQFRDHWARADRRTEEQHALIRERARRMVAAYAHDSCRAVLLYTQHELDGVNQLLPAIVDDAVGDKLRGKMKVCRPTVTPIDIEAIRDKWAAHVPLRILFCGRWYRHKKGEVALRVFHRLQQQFGGLVKLVYIGHVPDSVTAAEPHLLHNVEHLTDVPRARVLEEMERSHLLLHPSESEGLGMVLLEAAAAGMVVVCARDDGMQHTDEWFGDGGTLRVDRAGMSEENEIDWFAATLSALIQSPERSMRHGLENHEQSTAGVLSKHARDRVLLELYDKACHVACQPLTLDALGAGFVRSYSGHEIRGMKSAQTLATGTSREAVRIYIDV